MTAAPSYSLFTFCLDPFYHVFALVLAGGRQAGMAFVRPRLVAAKPLARPLIRTISILIQPRYYAAIHVERSTILLSGPSVRLPLSEMERPSFALPAARSHDHNLI